MKRYAKYKDSGISWIGDVPEHWDVTRIRHIFEESDEKIANNSGTLLSLSQYTGVSLKSECEKTGMFEAESTEGYKIVHKGQFVMNIMLAWNGSYAVSDLDGVISPAYCVFNFITECDKWYFHYLLRIKAYSGAFKTLSKGIIDSRLRLYPNKFYTFPVAVPPLEEQKAIAEFLDNKTKQINELVSAKQKQIELLKEYKQAVIAKAVTQGVNPKTKMKDSGISWIGQIPKHWDITRIRHIFEESDEKIEDNSGILLSLSQYTGISLKSDCEKTGMSEAESTEGYKIVHKGQFVMNIMLAWNGSYAVSDLEGIISPAYCVFNFITKCNQWYIHYLLRIKAYSGAFKTLSKGIIDSRLRLYPNKFYTFPVIVPPPEEQSQIVAFIKEKVSAIDSQIASIEKQIANLNEYKQSLISDVVTGKVKVA